MVKTPFSSLPHTLSPHLIPGSGVGVGSGLESGLGDVVDVSPVPLLSSGVVLGDVDVPGTSCVVSIGVGIADSVVLFFGVVDGVISAAAATAPMLSVSKAKPSIRMLFNLDLYVFIFSPFLLCANPQNGSD